MREIRTYGSTGRGSETGHGDDYTGTKPETADTDKSEPTGWLAHFAMNREGNFSVCGVVERCEKAAEGESRFLARVRPIIFRAEGASP